MLDEVIDFVDQFFNAAERTASNSALRDDIKPDFDLIEPRGVRWRVVDMEARVQCEPAFDRRMLVCGIVVHNQMKVECGWNAQLDLFEEAEILLMTVALLARSNDFTASNVESGEKGCCSMSLVVMGNTFDVTQSHGKHGLSAIKGLDLALLINAQDHRFVRGMKVKANNITHFLDEERVSGELKMALAVWLKPKGLPDSQNGLMR